MCDLKRVEAETGEEGNLVLEIQRGVIVESYFKNAFTSHIHYGGGGGLRFTELDTLSPKVGRTEGKKKKGETKVPGTGCKEVSGNKKKKSQQKKRGGTRKGNVGQSRWSKGGEELKGKRDSRSHRMGKNTSWMDEF